MKRFQDHFSHASEQYRRHRPAYPVALFEWLAGACQAQDVAWDCATGSGQAAIGLAAHFRQVIASDASARQLAAARPHSRVSYLQARAEASALAGQSMDLVSVAQAAHWFDHAHFNHEVMRVLRPGGLVALWTYGLASIDEEVDRLLYHFYDVVVGPYWPAERSHVAAAYRTLPFPFREIATPVFSITTHWSLDDLLGYLSTWSATQRCLEATGSDPVAEWRARFRAAWAAKPDVVRAIRWPLHLRAGRMD